ncbi:MAG: restriction endonuclease subunit S [Nocardioidaceae bacterium]
MSDYIRLGELVTLQRGTTYKGAQLGEPGPVLLGLGAIQRNGGFRADNLKTYGGDSPAKLILGPGDLFLSLKDVAHAADLLGALARVPRHVAAGRLTQDTVRLDLTSDRVSSEYLYWSLRTPDYREYCRSHATGTTNLGLSREDFFAYRIPAPSLERVHMVQLLGALDDKIAANSKRTETIDLYLAAVFGEIRSRCEQQGFLRDVADINGDSVKPVAGGTLRYIDIASVGVGDYEYPDVIAWEEAPSRARRGVRKGDTIWSTVRPNRRSHALNLSADPLLVASTGLAVLSPREVGFAYLYEVTKCPAFTTYLERAAEGSAYPAVRADRFGDALIPIFPHAEHDGFEATAAPMRELAHSLEVENRTLSATRDALLPQLMSGKIRVKDAEKTFGEVL